VSAAPIDDDTIAALDAVAHHVIEAEDRDIERLARMFGDLDTAGEAMAAADFAARTIVAAVRRVAELRGMAFAERLAAGVVGLIEARVALIPVTTIEVVDQSDDLEALNPNELN
jgi:hypothetical protein